MIREKSTKTAKCSLSLAYVKIKKKEWDYYHL